MDLVCTYVYLCTDLRTHTHIYVYMYICIYVYMYICVYVYICAYVCSPAFYSGLLSWLCGCMRQCVGEGPARSSNNLGLCVNRGNVGSREPPSGLVAAQFCFFRAQALRIRRQSVAPNALMLRCRMPSMGHWWVKASSCYRRLGHQSKHSAHSCQGVAFRRWVGTYLMQSDVASASNPKPQTLLQTLRAWLFGVCRLCPARWTRNTRLHIVGSGFVNCVSRTPQCDRTRAGHHMPQVCGGCIWLYCLFRSVYLACRHYHRGSKVKLWTWQLP